MKCKCVFKRIKTQVSEASLQFNFGLSQMIKKNDRKQYV